MNLECLNTIITDNLAIHIDLTNLKSWNLNTGFTSFSLTKWKKAFSDNINLIDLGLTGFDNGKTNIMHSGITLTPKDNLFSMYRIGYNDIYNPTSNNTSGYTAITRYDIYPMYGVTTGQSGNYFDLNGGYLQGFFKLNGYNYELLPARYGKGITIETLVNLYPNSYGIFYTMGLRAEDKFNTYFSGETIVKNNEVTGVTTSFNNYLDSLKENITIKKAFSSYEDNKTVVYSQIPQLDNIENNIIAFEITQDKYLAYKYIDSNGIVIEDKSLKTINNSGFTLISITYTPNENIVDPDILECAERRTGKLTFYINGRSVWTIKEYPEFYFHSIINDKEKQIGVPYSISWGGGSFGLKHSWHYDIQSYSIYTGQNNTYINNNIFVQGYPLPTECIPIPDESYLNGLSISANSNTFYSVDECNPLITHPITVMSINYTGQTGTTSGNTFLIKFNHPISILSNRDYDVKLSIFDKDFFKRNLNIVNKASILIYSDETDVNIIEDNEYTYPSSGNSNVWVDLKSKFNIPDNSGKKNVYIGLLLETNDSFNLNQPFYVKDFIYTGADILTQDNRKRNLTIEQNFDSGFIGGIQKLRVYDNALTSQEILHNAFIEANNYPDLNFIVSKGGRIIYR
jgi:hypothetical protein